MTSGQRCCLSQQQIQTIALGLGEPEVEPLSAGSRSREQRAWQRVRDHLADRLLAEVWTRGSVSDVGIWGPALSRREAERMLREAVERGVIYLDPVPAPVTGGASLGRWARVLRRAFGR